jgi:hypothetical protein
MIANIGPEGQKNIVLNGSGAGTAKVGPLSSREVWNPANVHVSVATHVAEATCNIYVGEDTSAKNFRDATFTGSSGDATGKVSSDVVKVGHYVFAVWTGGDAGALATMTVTGSKTI